MDPYIVQIRQCLAYIRQRILPLPQTWKSTTQQVHMWAVESGAGPGTVWRTLLLLGMPGSDITAELNGLTRLDLLLRLDRSISDMRKPDASVP